MRISTSVVRGLGYMPVQLNCGDMQKIQIEGVHTRNSKIFSGGIPAASCSHRSFSGNVAGRPALLSVSLWMRTLETPVPQLDELSKDEQTDYRIAFLALAKGVMEKHQYPGRAVDIGLKAVDFCTIPYLPGLLSTLRSVTKNILGFSEGMRMAPLVLDKEAQHAFDQLVVCSEQLLQAYRTLPRNAYLSNISPEVFQALHHAFDDLKTHIARLENARYPDAYPELKSSMQLCVQRRTVDSDFSLDRMKSFFFVDLLELLYAKKTSGQSSEASSEICNESKIHVLSEEDKWFRDELKALKPLCCEITKKRTEVEGFLDAQGPYIRLSTLAAEKLQLLQDLQDLDQEFMAKIDLINSRLPKKLQMLALDSVVLGSPENRI